MVRKNLFQNCARLPQILRWKILCHLQPETYKTYRNVNPDLCPIIFSISLSFTFWLRWKANKEWQELQSPHREKRPQQSIAASSLTDVCKETCPKWAKNRSDRNTEMVDVDFWQRYLGVTQRVDNIMTHHLKNDKLLMCSQVTYLNVKQRLWLLLQFSKLNSNTAA